MFSDAPAALAECIGDFGTNLTLTKASLNWRPIVPGGCSKRMLNTIALISPFETQQVL
jgi:hypothetical protein